MENTDKSDRLPLSKWWTTESCKAAMRRAKEKKQARIAVLKAYMQAKREALRAELAKEEADYQQELASR